MDTLRSHIKIERAEYADHRGKASGFRDPTAHPRTSPVTEIGGAVERGGRPPT
jgi:hypothetical protein